MTVQIIDVVLVGLWGSSRALHCAFGWCSVTIVERRQNKAEAARNDPRRHRSHGARPPAWHTKPSDSDFIETAAQRPSASAKSPPATMGDAKHAVTAEAKASRRLCARGCDNGFDSATQLAEAQTRRD